MLFQWRKMVEMKEMSLTGSTRTWMVSSTCFVLITIFEELLMNNKVMLKTFTCKNAKMEFDLFIVKEIKCMQVISAEVNVLNVLN